MSLAAGGMGGMGAGGAGGMVMAHQANAMARPMQPNAPPQANIPNSSGAAPPVSAAALGADLVDKNQALSLKNVKDLSKFPLVAIDLYGSEPIVAAFPPKPEDPSDRVFAGMVGKMRSRIALQPTEAANKTLRKWLSKSKGYLDLKADTLSTDSDKTKTVVIENPEQWLGLRRLADAPDYIRSQVNEDESSSPLIAEESSQGVGVTMTNSTLDGSSPQGDDFDRVVAKVRLHESKKAVTILPEESVQILLNQAQYHVAKKLKIDFDEEDIVEYPCSIAVPGAYCNDASIEALLDATGGMGVIFQRSICAMAGSLLPGTEGKPNAIVEHLNQVVEAMQKAFTLENVNNPDAVFEEDVIILIAGVSKDTAECTAIQLSSSQPSNYSCLYGNYRVMTSVSYRSDKPQSVMDRCINEVYENLDSDFPEADGPVAFVSYGTAEEQNHIVAGWSKLQKSLEDWEKLPHFKTKSDCVALGTAVLGAISHGRLIKVVQLSGKKPKARPALQIQNVAPVAVGVQMNYHGGKSGEWRPVKTIFDFDRRVPAGPYSVDLDAAECAVFRSGATDLSEEDLLKAIKANEGSTNIPKREEAALNLRVQIMQKWDRDGEWKPVGDVFSPLVQTDKDDNKTGCERVGLELTLGATGLITHSLAGERESVVQAVKSARNSALQYYIGAFVAILFFGGFLVKSYWEEKVFDRDTKRLLAFYKHAIPGSISDGDVNNARYLVWKYRGKKDKLWISLEKKYGHPVLLEHEWQDQVEETVEETNDEEHADLDRDEEAKPEQDL